MVRSKRLEPIRKLAKNKEKKAAEELGASLELQKLENQKLVQLETYRSEYLEGMEEKIRQGVSGATLQQYHQFLNKLELAISQQKDVLVQCQQKIEHNQGQWKDDHNRHKAIGQVMQSFQDKEQKQKLKKESNQNDEISTQSFIRRQNSNSLT